MSLTKIIIPVEEALSIAADVLMVDLDSHVEQLSRLVESHVNEYIDIKTLHKLKSRDKHPEIVLKELAEELHGGGVDGFDLSDLTNEVREVTLHGITINPWGVYSCSVRNKSLTLEYLGDYRIIAWSESDDAKQYQHLSEQQRVHEGVIRAFRIYQ